MPFDSPDLNLGDLMRSVGNGKIQLPDFQREWKWDNDRISGLLASIAVGHPVGVIMMLEVGGDGIRFAPKAIAGVNASSVSTPERLLLDGQQRLTSLFQALASGKPVDTTDSRGKRLKRWFYVDINAALASQGDADEAIVSVPEDRMLKDNFGREIVADYSTIEKECLAEVFPLATVFDAGSMFRWQNTYMSIDPDHSQERATRWVEFYDRVLSNFIGYVVPVIVLTKETPKEAVCTVFEKVNTGGVALNVFELLTATFAADDFRLNDDWKERKSRLDSKPVLRSLESTDFLQSISLLATWKKREQHFSSGGSPSEAPGVSAKRKDILRLTLEEYREWAEPTTVALEWAYSFLSNEKIFRATDLPYRTQLVPLAAIHAVLGASAEAIGAVKKLRQWYWCGVLGELYGGSTETRFARDLEQVVEWIKGGPPPNTVVEASFRAQRLLTLRTRNSAAYKGVHALVMRNDCRDWIKDEVISLANFFDYAIDIHHIFPKAWCNKNGVDAYHRESIVNKTGISATTNRFIGGRSPADYVGTLETRSGLGSHELNGVLESHLIDASSLRSAEFDGFFEARTVALLDLISAAMGKEMMRDEALDTDSPVDFEVEPDDIEEELEAEGVAG